MVSTVRSRPTHYELLGLTPAASGDEIWQAFAKALSLLSPRPFGSLAEVTVAYETLRDAAKRKAYDASLGLRQDPLRPGARAPADWKPFVARASVKSAELPAIGPVARPREQPQPDRPKPEMAPSATAMLRQPVRSETLRRPELEENPQPVSHRALHFVEFERGRDEGEARSDWRLPSLIAGGLALAVAIGAWSGWSAGRSDDSAEHPARIATPEVPPAKRISAADDTAPIALPSLPQARPQAPRPAAPRGAPRPASKIAPPPEPVESQSTEATGTEQSMPAVATDSAQLPLAKSVIARTISRIGYACGEVASSTALGGGVFTVTCTSGDTYRAAPVRGRYHFRRLR